jgi:hypothetical protein
MKNQLIWKLSEHKIKIRDKHIHTHIHTHLYTHTLASGFLRIMHFLATGATLPYFPSRSPQVLLDVKNTYSRGHGKYLLRYLDFDFTLSQVYFPMLFLSCTCEARQLSSTAMSDPEFPRPIKRTFFPL